MKKILLGLTVLSRLAFAIEGGHAVDETSPIYNSLAVVFAINNTTKETFYCSAARLTPELVVTAGHCLFPGSPAKSYGYAVHVGNANVRNFNENHKQAEVVAVRVPPEFRGPTAQEPLGTFPFADIALIKVKPIPNDGSDFLKPLFDDSILKEGMLVQVVGAGRTSDQLDDSEYVFRIMKAQVSKFNSQMKLLEVNYIPDLTFYRIFHWFSFVGLDHGDSGGPALVVIDGEWRLWGVDSGPGRYTPLSLYKDWLSSAAHEMNVDPGF